MQVPTYKDSITVGGSSQTKTFTAFPKEMINRQSGQLSLFYYDQYNNDYDMSGLTSLDLKSTPWDSGETPVTLSTGAIGYTPEIITLTASSVPATSGTFTINVNGEVTSALDWNSDNSDILTALEGLASRTAGDFTVNRRNGANLSIAGTEMEIETSGSYSIDYPITIDTSSLDITTGISSDTTQAGSSIQNAFIAEWDKDVIPADYSTYDFDRDGAIVFFVATEDANDFYQAYQRLNIVDDSFSGQQESSSNEATYNYNPADNNAWLRHATSAPTDTGGALDIYARQNFRDFGMVLDQQATPPTSPSDGDAYIVTATATDDWAGYENKIARYSSTLSAWEFSNVHRDWDEVRDDSDSEIYRWNADTSTWDLVGSTGSLAGLDDVTITSEAQGDILYYNGSAWVNLVAGTSGKVLVTQGAGANPIWGASVGTIGDLSDVTMTSEAIGDIIYYNGTAWVNLAAGTAGQFLQTQGNASDPIWGDASGGTSSESWVRLEDGDYTASGAFDLSTAGSTQTQAVSGETSHTGIFFSQDGSKVFLTGEGTDAVREFDLSTAFDVSTISAVQVTMSTTSQTQNPQAVCFTSDGLEMYIGKESPATIFQYTLSTAWDLSTATYTDSYAVSGDMSSSLRDISIKPDGSKIYALETSGDVYEWNLTSGDITTASFVQSYNPSESSSTVHGFAMASDGTKMLISANSNGSFYEYSLSTAFDVSTATYTTENITMLCRGLTFSSDGFRVASCGSGNIYDKPLGTKAYDLAINTNYIVEYAYEHNIPEAPSGESTIKIKRNTASDHPQVLAQGSDTFDDTSTTLDLDTDKATAELIYNETTNEWEVY